MLHILALDPGKCDVSCVRQQVVCFAIIDALATAGSNTSRIVPRDPVRSSEQHLMKTMNKGNQLINEGHRFKKGLTVHSMQQRAIYSQDVLQTTKAYAETSQITC